MNKISFFVIYVLTGYAAVDLDHIQDAKERYAKAYSQCQIIGSHIDPHNALVVAYFVKEGDLILDVGTYVGDYAQYYGKLVGGSGKVIAYEANPYVFPYTTKRLLSLGATNITLKQKAVSSTTGQKLWMRVYPNDLGPQSCTVEPDLMYEERMPAARTALVEVETEQLDDILSAEPVRFIKIDVEGHEHAVLEGVQQLLHKDRPVVIFEYGSISGKEAGNPIAQMEKQGYLCFDLRTDQRILPHAVSTGTDVVAVPLEYASELQEVLPHLYGVDCRKNEILSKKPLITKKRIAALSIIFLLAGCFIYRRRKSRQICSTSSKSGVGKS